MSRWSLQVRTPEGIVFTQELAGPASRFLAWLVDLLILFTLLTVLNIVAGFLMVVDPELGQGIAILLGFVLNTGYKIAAEWLWRGQTVGKRVMRLRVVDAEGLRLRFSQVLLRIAVPHP